jgi:hypothetical protein
MINEPQLQKQIRAQNGTHPLCQRHRLFDNLLQLRGVLPAILSY